MFYRKTERLTKHENMRVKYMRQHDLRHANRLSLVESVASAITEELQKNMQFYHNIFNEIVEYFVDLARKTQEAAKYLA